tara:strand:+ start:562 stop:675 length:114 start_codon:yes stop_codon:yes gene_type:complete
MEEDAREQEKALFAELKQLAFVLCALVVVGFLVPLGN